MVGWYHWLDGHEIEQAPGVGDGQGSLACCSSWGCKESDMTKWLNWCHSLWTPAWFPYTAQQKMCPNGVQACQEGASSIILQEAGLKIWCDIPSSLSVLCQWMREKPYKPVSQYIMPWDCGLSIFSSTWELIHLSIPNIGFPEKIQFGKTKVCYWKYL